VQGMKMCEIMTVTVIIV